jgi:PhnB protein
MAERLLPDQLDDAVEAILAPDEEVDLQSVRSADVDASLAPLLSIAADLRDLPTERFKARLKAQLERSSSMIPTVQPIPAGYRTVTICLVVRDGLRAMDWYVEAFGATELSRFVDPENGSLQHGEIRIGNSRIALAEEAPHWHNLSPLLLGGTSASVALEVEDADALAGQAVAAGARLERPVEDQFYGARSGSVVDPFGHRWLISSKTEDVSPEEMQRRYDDITRPPGGN